MSSVCAIVLKLFCAFACPCTPTRVSGKTGQYDQPSWTATSQGPIWFLFTAPGTCRTTLESFGAVMASWPSRCFLTCLVRGTLLRSFSMHYLIPYQLRICWPTAHWAGCLVSKSTVFWRLASSITEHDWTISSCGHQELTGQGTLVAVEFCAAQQRWHRGACPKKSFRILESKLYKMTPNGLLGPSHKSPRNLSFELRYLSCLLLFLLVIGHKARLGQEQTRRQIQKDTRM